MTTRHPFPLQWNAYWNRLVGKSMVTRLAAAAVLLLAGAVAAQAQPAARVYRIGLVITASPGLNIDAFRQGLRELGYVEGKNVIVEARFAKGAPNAFPSSSPR